MNKLLILFLLFIGELQAQDSLVLSVPDSYLLLKYAKEGYYRRQLDSMDTRLLDSYATAYQELNQHNDMLKDIILRDSQKFDNLSGIMEAYAKKSARDDKDIADMKVELKMEKKAKREALWASVIVALGSGTLLALMK